MRRQSNYQVDSNLDLSSNFGSLELVIPYMSTWEQQFLVLQYSCLNIEKKIIFNPKEKPLQMKMSALESSLWKIYLKQIIIANSIPNFLPADFQMKDMSHQQCIGSTDMCLPPCLQSPNMFRRLAVGKQKIFSTVQKQFIKADKRQIFYQVIFSG